MKTAIVHDWLTGMRGGEKVLELFCELFPDADIYTLLHIKGAVSPTIEKHKITVSFLQKMPFIKSKYPYYLPLMPRAIESFDLSNYDLVLSSSHCAAKGCRTNKNQVHICYCYTPMRYIWDQYDNYFSSDQTSFVTSVGMRTIRPFLQRWDVKSSERITNFIAISHFVKDRILKYYGRDSEVIYPPVRTDYFTPALVPVSDENPFYLIVSALVPYKRIDLAIEAFNRNGKKLKVIGRGHSLGKLKKAAKSNIEFLGWSSDDVLLDYYRSCKALIFPGTEDFGIVPLEAQSCGKAVIAYRAGGALETIKENESGIFFSQQTPESLLNAIEEFEKRKWDPAAIRKNTLRFSQDQFLHQIKAFFRKMGTLHIFGVDV